MRTTKSILVWLLCAGSFAAEFDFTVNPKWEGFRNHLLPVELPTTKQDFGQRGDKVGGWVQRSMTPASFAKAIEPKSLEDRLTASGRFTVTKDAGFSGVLFGWFHETSRGWRTPNSMALRLDGNGGRYWVFVEYGTRNWLTGGRGAFEGEEYQTTRTKPFPADGTPHQWSLTYDPQGANGNGELVLMLDGKSYRVELAPGHKRDGATFNRFGMWNQHASGHGMEILFDELEIDGEREDFEPPWIGVGNKAEFPERCVRPLHDFGYTKTRHAGGAPGEIGGLIWRDEAPACYAAKIKPVTFTNELYAAGKLAFLAAGSDSAVYLGWFDAASKTNKNTTQFTDPQRNLMAILIEGPSRVGHYFRPAYAAADGKGEIKESGPLIKPDARVHTWSIRYKPKPNSGEIVVTLDGSVQTMEVRREHFEAGATFDRFGFFNLQRGGHYVELYVDNLMLREGPE